MHRADFLASVSHLMPLYRRRAKAVKPSPNSIPVLGVNANPLRRPQHILSLVSRQKVRARDDETPQLRPHMDAKLRAESRVSPQHV